VTLVWKDAKDPADIAWYAVDCVSFLGDSEIATGSFTVPDGLTNVQELFTATEARIKLSGGDVGVSYLIGLLLTTTDNQTFQRDIKLKVKDL
jgi:hypothetical protein